MKPPAPSREAGQQRRLQPESWPPGQRPLLPLLGSRSDLCSPSRGSSLLGGRSSEGSLIFTNVKKRLPVLLPFPLPCFLLAASATRGVRTSLAPVEQRALSSVLPAELVPAAVTGRSAVGGEGQSGQRVPLAQVARCQCSSVLVVKSHWLLLNWSPVKSVHFRHL